MKIEDIPSFDRPREKALREGLDALSDEELLAIIINNGYRGGSALDIADELLTKSKGLYNLNNLNQKDLKKVKGIKKVKAIQLMSLFTIMKRIKNQRINLEDRIVDAEYINEKYGDYLSSLSQEAVLLLVLNRNKKLVFEVTLYRGSGSLVPISINEVIKNVILHDGYYFYLVHNHPNGNREPSPQDILLTIRLNSSIKNMGIYLIDHIIIHHYGYTSIKKYLKEEYSFRNIRQLIPQEESNKQYAVSED